MGLFDKFKKKEEKQENVITPQVNNEMSAESNNLGQNAITQIEQVQNATEEVPSLPENQFVDNSTPVMEQPVVENTQPQPNVPSFDNIFNATPADLIPTPPETYTQEQINETVLATGAQIEESKPIVEQQIALDVNIEDVVEGGITKEDEITRIVSETIANRDKKEKQNDAILPDIEDVSSKVEPQPVEVAAVKEISTPAVEVQSSVESTQEPIQTDIPVAPIVEVTQPIAEIAPVVEIPTPVVEVQTQVESTAPVVEAQEPSMPVQESVQPIAQVVPVVEEQPTAEVPSPVVENTTPIVEVQETSMPVQDSVQPIAQVVPVVEEQPIAEMPSPVVEIPAPAVAEPTPVAEMPTPILETPAPTVEIPMPETPVQTEVQTETVITPSTIVLPAVEEPEYIELPSNPFEENIEPQPQVVEEQSVIAPEVEESTPVQEVEVTANTVQELPQTDIPVEPIVEVTQPIAEISPVVEIPTPVVEVQTPVESTTPEVEVQEVTEPNMPIAVESPVPQVSVEPQPILENTTSAAEEQQVVEIAVEPVVATIPVTEVSQIIPEPISTEIKQPNTEIQQSTEDDLNNDVQNFENNFTVAEQVEEEPQPATEEQEENFEPVIVQDEPEQLAPANINDPIVEKKAVENSPILPQEEQNSISEEQLVERKEEPRSYIEEKKKITRFCDECGTMVTDDGVVCPECGMPIK